MKKLIAVTLIIPFLVLSLFGCAKQHYAGEGALIGAGSGAILGGVIIFAASGSCDHAEEVEDCEGMRGLAVLTGTGIGLAGGAAIGAVIGAAIKKKPKVAVTPMVGYSPDGSTSYGLGIQGRF